MDVRRLAQTLTGLCATAHRSSTIAEYGHRQEEGLIRAIHTRLGRKCRYTQPLYRVDCSCTYQNAFFEVFGIYWTVYKMFAGDPLHEIEGGEAGKHFWIFLMQLHILDKDMKARVDDL